MNIILDVISFAVALWGLGAVAMILIFRGGMLGIRSSPLVASSAGPSCSISSPEYQTPAGSTFCYVPVEPKPRSPVTPVPPWQPSARLWQRRPILNDHRNTWGLYT